MKSKVVWIIGGIIAFLVFAIAYMPAVHVISRIDLPKNVSISSVSGTLFSGKAQTIVVNGLPINNLKWTLSPLHILIGKVKVEVQAGNIRDKNEIAFQGQLTTPRNDLSRAHCDRGCAIWGRLHYSGGIPQGFLEENRSADPLPLATPRIAKGFF